MNKYDEAMKLLEEQAGNKDALLSLSTIALEPGANGKAVPPPVLWTPIMRTVRSTPSLMRPQARCSRSPKTPKSPFVSSSKTLRPMVSVKTWAGYVTRKTRR